MVDKFMFGKTAEGKDVTAYRIINEDGSSVTLLDRGATVQSICLPHDGGTVDVALGYDTVGEYEVGTCYLGAAIGRVGNRIGKAKFSIDGQEYPVTANERGNCLHGGAFGFDKKIWNADVVENDLIFTVGSPDGEEGFPGDMQAEIRYHFADRALTISYKASVSKPCPVNLTNHIYFNLNGQGEGTILGHKMKILADRVTDVDEQLIPTGVNLPVDGTPFDFRETKEIGRDLDETDRLIGFGKGYDHNFCLTGEGFRKVLELEGEKTGLSMEVWTDQCGIQVYCGGCYPDEKGKNGTDYTRFAGIALETQNYPDAVNHLEFPNSILKPGEEYETKTMYCFV